MPDPRSKMRSIETIEADVHEVIERLMSDVDETGHTKDTKQTGTMRDGMDSSDAKTFDETVVVKKDVRKLALADLGVTEEDVKAIMEGRKKARTAIKEAEKESVEGDDGKRKNKVKHVKRKVKSAIEKTSEEEIKPDTKVMAKKRLFKLHQ